MPSRYSVPSASTIVEPSLRVTTICLVSSALCWTIGCRTLPRSCCTTAARTAGSGEFNSDMAASLKGEGKTADANALAVILPGCGRLPQCNRAGVERRSAGAQSGAIKTVRMMRLTGRRAVGEVDSGYAWLRLLAGVLTSTIGGVGMCSIAVVLPTLQADFGVTRADVSLAYTAVMLGAVVGGPVMGWLSDRFGITVPVAIGTVMLALGLALASQAATMCQFTLVHGLLIGGGTSASFGP